MTIGEKPCPGSRKWPAPSDKCTSIYEELLNVRKNSRGRRLCGAAPVTSTEVNELPEQGGWQKPLFYPKALRRF